MEGLEMNITKDFEGYNKNLAFYFESERFKQRFKWMSWLDLTFNLDLYGFYTEKRPKGRIEEEAERLVKRFQSSRQAMTVPWNRVVELG